MPDHGVPPRARREGLLVETVGEELLIYDQNSHTAHCLSTIAACVWRHCNGKHKVTELAIFAGATEELVANALHELYEKNLLDAEPTLSQSAGPGVSRREAISRAVRVSAGAAAGSLVVSATAATPAMASSGKEECTIILGQKSSCCECKDGTCINFAKIVEQKECEEECKAHNGWSHFADEGLCQ